MRLTSNRHVGSNPTYSAKKKHLVSGAFFVVDVGGERTGSTRTGAQGAIANLPRRYPLIYGETVSR